jgi:hypothetical protein
MHDTPATEFFAQSRRDFSHGCIRLEKPADMAAWVLRDKPGWTPEKIHAAMTSGPDAQQVNLAHPIPVLIVYATVVVLEDGLVHFYDDIYGHDAALQKVLAKGYPYPASRSRRADKQRRCARWCGCYKSAAGIRAGRGWRIPPYTPAARQIITR